MSAPQSRDSSRRTNGPAREVTTFPEWQREESDGSAYYYDPTNTLEPKDDWVKVTRKGRTYYYSPRAHADGTIRRDR